MKYDFENDLKLELQSNISKFGIKIPMKDCSEMLLDFLTIHKKLIYQKPRAVFINPELEKKLNSHPKRKEVLLIKEMFIRGSNLNVFQSKKLYQTKFHDHLVYEWDIHHFHLSSKIDKGKKIC